LLPEESNVIAENVDITRSYIDGTREPH